MGGAPVSRPLSIRCKTLHSARNNVAVGVREANNAGIALSALPMTTKASNPRTNAVSGMVVTGVTPIEAAKVAHTQRPAANPSPNPTIAAIIKIAVVCQTTMARTWRRVIPSDFNIANSRRLRRAPARMVPAKESSTAAAKTTASVKG